MMIEVLKTVLMTEQKKKVIDEMMRVNLELVPDENFWQKHRQNSESFSAAEGERIFVQGKCQCHFMPRSMQLVAQSWRPKMWLKVQVTP